MSYKFFISLLLLSIHVACLKAQEVEFPLSGNTVIQEFNRNHPLTPQSQMRRAQNVLSLPFHDDFSAPLIYPDPMLWSDSGAYINQTMSDNPVSLGVATLDGIDKFGYPYDSNSVSVQPVICDHLTSQPIDLSGYSSASDVYFSFYYQPQGLGDEPEDGDSLVLEFYSSNGVDSDWVHVWVANGMPHTAFTEVKFKIDDPVYFWGGFRFRFYNYATPNGNRDHWNIDYVQVKINPGGTQLLNDITLVYPVKSYLNDFTSMPYTHYKSEISAGHNPIDTLNSDMIRVYDFSGTTTITEYSEIKDQGGNLLNTLTIGDWSLTSTFVDTTFLFTPPQNLFPSTSAEVADFYIKHYFTGTNAADSLPNDSSFYTQRFSNYYSYDDGTAESATGVHVAYTSYAYQFDVKQADSLLGISIFFNPWGKNVYQDLFSLCLWDNVSVSGNSATLVYQSIDNKPEHNGAINGFVDYYFDVPQWVNAGTHYFGIIQSSINEIGLGVDHNIDSHDKMFLNFNNQWYQSGITGTWMMRPIFGKKLSIGIGEQETAISNFEVYPNPAEGMLTLKKGNPVADAEITMFNMPGEKVLELHPGAGSQRSSWTIDVSKIPSGIYFIRLTDKDNSFSEVRKCVISH